MRCVFKKPFPQWERCLVERDLGAFGNALGNSVVGTTFGAEEQQIGNLRTPQVAASTLSGQEIFDGLVDAIQSVETRSLNVRNNLLADLKIGVPETDFPLGDGMTLTFLEPEVNDSSSDTSFVGKFGNGLRIAQEAFTQIDIGSAWPEYGTGLKPLVTAVGEMVAGVGDMASKALWAASPLSDWQAMGRIADGTYLETEIARAQELSPFRVASNLQSAANSFISDLSSGDEARVNYRLAQTALTMSGMLGATSRVAGMEEALGQGVANSEFVPAARSGLSFETRISQQGESLEVELLSKQKFDKVTGEVVENRFARSNLLSRYNDGNLHIDWYETSVTGRGIGTEMISRAIETAGPQNVSSVTAQLGLKNLSAFQQSVGAGMVPIEAVWQTPLGKSMSSLRYRNVTFNGSSNFVRFTNGGY